MISGIVEGRNKLPIASPNLVEMMTAGVTVMFGDDKNGLTRVAVWYLVMLVVDVYKVMRRDRQRDEVTSSTSVVISEALKRAAQRAGAQPTTSHSELTQDVTDNSALCAAFQHEMNTAIAHRLTNDTDYMPDKYPNITKFFKSE